MKPETAIKTLQSSICNISTGIKAVTAAGSGRNHHYREHTIRHQRKSYAALQR